MANEKVNKDPEVIIESALSRTEQWIESNGKKLLIILAVVVLVVGGYFGYKHLYQAPQAEKASAAMFHAQSLFEQDSVAAALKGDAKNLGFEQIIDEFSGTPQANIAKHYAGVCYLYMGEYQKAIDMLQTFSKIDGALGTIITAQNIGLTGDAYAELGNLPNALDCYIKAANYSDNSDTAPTYLHKAAVTNLELGKTNEALAQFQTIKDKYPASLLARDIDKYIAYAQQKL